MKRAKLNGWLSLFLLFVGATLNVQAQTWSFSASMHYWHTSHTATLLNNGEVLVAAGGGIGNAYQNYSELYNPSTGPFSDTGSLNTASCYPKATLLNNGMVLVVNGTNWEL